MVPFFAKSAATAALFIFGILPKENPPMLPHTDTERQAMVDAVNELRSKGCKCGRRYMPPAAPIKWNYKLEKAALAHAQDMERNGFFGHAGSDGSSIGKRIERTGYRWRAVAENIAEGYGGFEATLRAWKASPGHCQNLMSPSYKEMGIAEANDLWVQDFGVSY